jgi:hypothetical protein
MQLHKSRTTHSGSPGNVVSAFSFSPNSKHEEESDVIVAHQEHGVLLQRELEAAQRGDLLCLLLVFVMRCLYLCLCCIVVFCFLVL